MISSWPCIIYWLSLFKRLRSLSNADVHGHLKMCLCFHQNAWDVVVICFSTKASCTRKRRLLYWACSYRKISLWKIHLCSRYSSEVMNQSRAALVWEVGFITPAGKWAIQKRFLPFITFELLKDVNILEEKERIEAFN